MTYRSAHGAAKNSGHLAVVETCPPDELPDGVPALPAQDRDPSTGRFMKGNGLAKLGGRARGEAYAMGRMLGFSELEDEHEFKPYLALMREYQKEHTVSLAESVGGGELSPGVAALIANAARFQAVSLYLHDRAVKTSETALFVTSGTMADRSRTALLTAFEMAAREAKARPPKPEDFPWLAPSPR